MLIKHVVQKSFALVPSFSSPLYLSSFCEIALRIHGPVSDLVWVVTGDSK